MSRERSYIKILESSANMQFNISLILEALATKAEKSRNWVCRHISAPAFDNHDDQLKQSIEIHEMLVGVIGGLTKLEYGMAKNMKVILGHDDSSASSFDFGNVFDQSGGNDNSL